MKDSNVDYSQFYIEADKWSTSLKYPFCLCFECNSYVILRVTDRGFATCPICRKHPNPTKISSASKFLNGWEKGILGVKRTMKRTKKTPKKRTF